MKKVLNIGLKILTWLLVAFTVFMMVFTIVTVTTVGQNDRNLFGFKFYIVRTGSMSKSENNADLDIHFDPGDIIIIRAVDDPRSLQAGDVITFLSEEDSEERDEKSKTVTHMIYEVKRSETGAVLGYVTYGTNTGAIDETLVEPEYVVGKYQGKLPGVGNFFAFVKSVPGYIICILVPFLLLILYNGINVIRLFRQYRREQMEAMQAERDKIEAERAENQRMMQELLALKAQLDKKESGEEAPPAPSASEAAPEGTEGAPETTDGEQSDS